LQRNTLGRELSGTIREIIMCSGENHVVDADEKTKQNAEAPEFHQYGSLTNLDRLRAVTKSLTPISQIMPDGARMNVQVLNTPCGTCIAFGLWKEPDGAILRSFYSAGTEYYNHEHKELELLGVFSGELRITLDGEPERIITAHQYMAIPPMIPHKVRTLIDTWIWVVTMPAVEEFPDG
jgi:hypothetical protein